ncbi:MAG: 50S ribosomal protein L24 [Winogradskyella sp.]|nr:50S ribosomal protein L24 [Winogradskyella sp.]
MKLKKGDKVEVISGSYKGTQGEILEIFPQKNKVVIDGVNLRKKHTKPTNDTPGGINEISAPIDLSNVMLVDPKSGKPTKVGRKEVDGKLVRYSKKSGEIIR